MSRATSTAGAALTTSPDTVTTDTTGTTSRTVTASGNPSELVKDPATDQSAMLFLTRGGKRESSEEVAGGAQTATSHKEQAR